MKEKISCVLALADAIRSVFVVCLAIARTAITRKVLLQSRPIVIANFQSKMRHTRAATPIGTLAPRVQTPQVSSGLEGRSWCIAAASARIVRIVFAVEEAVDARRSRIVGHHRRVDRRFRSREEVDVRIQ